MSGNLYLMSDVHGYFIPFLQILEKIRFEDADRMVILGDLVAKGPDSLGLLRFVMEHKNILALRGNHEQRLLQYFGTDRAAGIPDSTMRSWVAGDGAGIIRQMNMLSETGRRKVLEFIGTMPLWEVMEICGRKYVLVHGAPDDEMKKELLAVQKDPGGKRKTADYDVLLNRYESPDSDNRLPAGMTAVVGHTPTFKYGTQYAGDMIIRDDKIFLDCGAGQGYGLGCLEILSGNDKNSP